MSETDEQFVERMDDIWHMATDAEKTRLRTLARRGAAVDSTSAVVNLQRANDWLELENKRLKAAVQWRPIEEAPKDGTMVLLRDDAEDEELETIYFAMTGIWTYGKWHFPGRSGWQPSPWFVPLRWMPLPPTPSRRDER